MAKIEGIRIRNYKVLKDITIGKTWDSLEDKSLSEPLTPMTAVIGKNGVGKSTIFGALGFLSDCLKYGVEEACDLQGRGGFKRIKSHGQKGNIEFNIFYKDSDNILIGYYLNIALDSSKRPYVEAELLNHKEKYPIFGGMLSDNIISLLLVADGKAHVMIDDSEFETIELEDNRKLAIATLGSLKQHPRISAFRSFLEGWYLSYFTPDAARSLPLAGPQRHLNFHGDNLGNVVQFMEREHPERFQSILKRIAGKIPGIDKIDTLKSPDGRLLLRFNDKGFKDPFYAQQMSDGTLKVFAYLMLLEDPTPPPFICIEEPENGLYHKLLETLVQEFREHATGLDGGSQIFITTHQPYLVDALSPEEVWILEKGEDGFATIQRASSIPIVKNMAAEGLPLGGLWYSDYMDAR